MNTRLKEKTTELSGTHIPVLLLKYSIPAAIGNTVFTLYNIVDRIFIGQAIGTDAIAGIGVTFPIFMVCIAIGMLIGIGGGTLASLRLGEQKPEEAENILGNVVCLFIICGTVLGTIGMIFLRPLLEFFGADSNIMPYSFSYMSILLWFIPFDFIAMGTNNMLRAEGNPKISMYNLMIGAGANVVLDYIFIFPMKMGVEGAALATGLAKGISTAWIIYHFTLGKHRALTLQLKYFRLKAKLIIPLIKIGISPFSLQFINCIIVALLNRRLIEYGGSTAVGAMAVIFSIQMLIMMPTIGVIQGAQPIYGYNYGARQFDRVKYTLFCAIIIAIVPSLLSLALIQMFPGILIGLFNSSDHNLMQVGSHGIRIFMMLIPMAVFQVVGAHFFQATGRPQYSIFLNAFRQIICFIPLLYILPEFLGINGIWATAPAADVIAAIVTGVFLMFEIPRLKPIPIKERFEETEE